MLFFYPYDMVTLFFVETIDSSALVANTKWPSSIIRFMSLSHPYFDIPTHKFWATLIFLIFFYFLTGSTEKTSINDRFNNFHTTNLRCIMTPTTQSKPQNPPIVLCYIFCCCGHNFSSSACVKWSGIATHVSTTERFEQAVVMATSNYCECKTNFFAIA